MNYELSEFQYPSSDGKHTIHAEIFTPKAGTPRAVVQLSHGMVDFLDRYRYLADALCAAGFVFAGNCHLGHGKSAGCDEDLGIFDEDGGVDLILRDLHAMNKYLRTAYPNLPLVLLGHSMGSFIARVYAERYPHDISALIIHGTGGPNPALPLAKAIGATVEFFKGPRYRSPLITKLAFGSYNKKFDKSEGEDAWLTRDTAVIKAFENEKLSHFRFTVAGYRDLFRLVGLANAKKWFTEYPKHLPTLIVSGTMDPVGAYGKGPSYVYKHLLLAGCNNVTLKLYEGARHELHNETNRDEVFRDIIEWTESAVL